MSPQLTVFFTAMTPFLELKLAIPLGKAIGLSSTSTFIYAIAGTLVPAVIGLAVATPLSTFLIKKSKLLNKFLNYLFHKTRKHHSKNFARYGTIFLILFVGTPLPGSGAASGALIAFLFNVDYWKAITVIIIGSVLQAFLITEGVNSIINLINLLN